MKIVTHNGRFHVDDVFAVAATLMIYPEAEIIRNRDKATVSAASVAIDVGLVSDKDRNRFDHHQPEGAGSRANGIPFSSFGLVWQKWGEQLAGKEEAELIDRKLVSPIDANDNGLSISANKFRGVREYTIYDVISSYSEEDDFSEEVLMEKFKEAVKLAQSIIRREINIARREIADAKEIMKIAAQSQDRRMVVLDKNLLWLKALASIPEAFYVVYPRKDGTWGVQAVSKDRNDAFFELRKPLPKVWGGKTDRALADITEVKDAIFCHKALFLCVAKTKEGAIKLAELALNS